MIGNPGLIEAATGWNEATRKLNAHLFAPAAPPAKLQLTHAFDPAVPNSDKTSVAIFERRPRSRSLAKGQAKGCDSTFYLVRVTSYRTRLIDTDNLVPKWHVDSLRYAGIIPSDAPDRARIETRQEKVSGKENERTEIEVMIVPQSGGRSVRDAIIHGLKGGLDAG